MCARNNCSSVRPKLLGARNSCSSVCPVCPEPLGAQSASATPSNGTGCRRAYAGEDHHHDQQVDGACQVDVPGEQPAAAHPPGPAAAERTGARGCCALPRAPSCCCVASTSRLTRTCSSLRRTVSLSAAQRARREFRSPGVVQGPAHGGSWVCTRRA